MDVSALKSVLLVSDGADAVLSSSARNDTAASAGDESSSDSALSSAPYFRVLNLSIVRRDVGSRIRFNLLALTVSPIVGWENGANSSEAYSSGESAIRLDSCDVFEIFGVVVTPVGGGTIGDPLISIFVEFPLVCASLLLDLDAFCASLPLDLDAGS